MTDTSGDSDQPTPSRELRPWAEYVKASFGSTPLVSGGNSDIFVTKLDRDGKF